MCHPKISPLRLLLPTARPCWVPLPQGALCGWVLACGWVPGSLGTVALSMGVWWYQCPRGWQQPELIAGVSERGQRGPGSTADHSKDDQIPGGCDSLWLCRLVLDEAMMLGSINVCTDTIHRASTVHLANK